MCLVRVKETEEHVVPYRVVDRHNSRRRTSHQSQRRYSRTEIVHQESPRPSASYVAVPAPKPLPIPAPQPVPVFVQPPPAPIPAPAPPPPPSSHHGAAHYVEVSPRSSISSRSSSPPRSEYVYREREFRRERETGPQYDHYRYVEPQRSESEVGYARSRSRQRSMSRGGYEDPRGSFREERTRIVIEDERGGGGGRRRDYR